MAFSHSGFQVAAASSAEEALDLLREQRFDFLFLDLNLPGMNGLELAAKITATWPEIEMAAISGNFKSFGEEACRAAGFTHLLPKPIQLQDLLKVVQSDE